MSEVLDLPAIDPALIDTPCTDVAIAAAAALDLAKVDLTDVALAQFGPWRQSVAEVQQNIATLALDLSIQARIDEAKSLRRRLFDQPRADIRKVSKELKSKLAKVSKAIGAEEDAAVAAYDEAEKPLTAQIDAAQKVIDDEKEAKRQAENVRLSGLREAVDGIMAKWVERCNADGMTAERLGNGIEQFAELAMPPEVADVQAYWISEHAETLLEMRGLQRAAAAREEAARLEAQRLENERIAAELAAQQRALAEQAEALKRQADEFAAQQAAAAEAREQANREQCAFEDWVNKNSPSGDVEAVQRQWEASAEYHDLHGIEYSPATMATTEGKAETPGAGSAEAAPCPACGGNDGDVPCAYPGEGVAGCLRDLRRQAEREAAPQPGEPDFTVRDIVFSERGSAGATNVSIRLEDFASFDLRTDPPPPAPASDTAHAADIAGRDWSAVAFTHEDSIETSEREARPYAGPVQMIETARVEARMDRALAAACYGFLIAFMKAYEGRFPTHPKPSQEWWAERRKDAEGLLPELLAAAAGEGA